MTGLFVASLWGFGFVEPELLPAVDPAPVHGGRLAAAGHAYRRDRAQGRVGGAIPAGLEGVTHVSSLVGKGGLRFLLTYAPEKLNSAYAQLLVDVESSELLDTLLPRG